MPRCQWCRQDSQSADVCEWCKRPLGFAGAAPAAAPAPHGVAVANQMTFQDSSGGSNDRLLMYSMLGVVGMTLLAFLFSFMNRPAPEKATPVPAPIVVEQAPRPEGGSGASPVAPMPQAPAPTPVPQQVAELPPPTYTPAPAVQPPAQTYTGQRFGGNRKLGIALEGTNPQ